MIFKIPVIEVTDVPASSGNYIWLNTGSGKSCALNDPGNA